MDKRKLEEFNLVAKPLMDWIEKNYDPHHKAIVDSHRAELVSSSMATVKPL